MVRFFKGIVVYSYLSENDSEARLLRYQTDAKTEISVVSTEFLVKPARKVLSTFVLS